MSAVRSPGAGPTRRVVLLVVAVLAPALAGSGLIHALAMRDALLAQQALRNRDAALLLAQALGPARGDAAAAEALARAQFARGAMRRLRLVAGDGRARVDLERPAAAAAAAAAAPAWFRQSVAGTAAPGVATLADGAGELHVEMPDDAAVAALWRSALAISALLALALALAVVAAAFALRGWRRALAATVTQARAIEQARFVTAEEPADPELRDMTRAMNAMVRRLRELFDAQAAQVAELQRQAQTDAVSGLPIRAQFVARLGDLLADAAGPPAALLLVRLADLERLNQVHGREAIDRLLGAVADVLLTYVERVHGASAGRLNGTDFALCLPATGIAQETAESLRTALESTPAARLAGAEFLLGGCDGLHGIAPGAALAAADAALADAEAGEGTAIVNLNAVAPGGARVWREQIAEALAAHRTRLGAYAVIDARGALVHLECPLRVQLQPGGEFLEARRWLALATRSRLLPEVDLAAVDLALAAIAADGRPRCVHVASRSFARPEFAAALQARLDAAGADARRLAIEWTMGGRAAETATLAAAVAGWRRCGVTVGVEHAGASPKALPWLEEIGVDYVKVDARHLRGVADDEAVRGYAQSLLALIHGLGLQAIAAGIDEPHDLLALWPLGFDAATGSAVATPAL